MYRCLGVFLRNAPSFGTSGSAGRVPSFLRVYFDFIQSLFTDHLLRARPTGKIEMDKVPSIVNNLEGDTSCETMNDNVGHKQTVRKVTRGGGVEDRGVNSARGASGRVSQRV